MREWQLHLVETIFESGCSRHIWIFKLHFHKLISDLFCACQLASVLSEPQCLHTGREWSSHDGKKEAIHGFKSMGVLSNNSQNVCGKLIISDHSTIEDGMICP